MIDETLVRVVADQLGQRIQSVKMDGDAGDFVYDEAVRLVEQFKREAVENGDLHFQSAAVIENWFKTEAKKMIPEPQHCYCVGLLGAAMLADEIRTVLDAR